MYCQTTIFTPIYDPPYFSAGMECEISLPRITRRVVDQSVSRQVYFDGGRSTGHGIEGKE